MVVTYLPTVLPPLLLLLKSKFQNFTRVGNDFIVYCKMEFVGPIIGQTTLQHLKIRTHKKCFERPTASPKGKHEQPKPIRDGCE